MIPAAITMTVVTHPLQVLLVGLVLLRGARAALSAVVACWELAVTGSQEASPEGRSSHA